VRTVELTITKSHIDNGSMSNSGCPIALAMLDDIPDVQDVSVSENVIAFRDVSGSYRCRPPVAVVDFIRDFDDADPVEPTSFALDFEPADPTA
jgi:hypothetical protein